MSMLLVVLTWLGMNGIRVAFTVTAYAALLWFLVALLQSAPRLSCNIHLTTVKDESEEEEEEPGDEDYENKIRRLAAVIQIGDDCRRRNEQTALQEWDVARQMTEDLVPLPAVGVSK